MGTRDSSSSNATASAAPPPNVLHVLQFSWNDEILREHLVNTLILHSVPHLVFLPCSMLWERTSCGLCYSVTEHIRAFNCWLPADRLNLTPMQMRSAMIGVIKSLWLFRELMVEHNEPVKCLSERAAWQKMYVVWGQQGGWRRPEHDSAERGLTNNNNSVLECQNSLWKSVI